MVTGDTRERIMAAARLTVQDRGYSGLSFRELAKDVGIKSASIHHYSRPKANSAAPWPSAIAMTSRTIWTGYGRGPRPGDLHAEIYRCLRRDAAQ